MSDIAEMAPDVVEVGRPRIVVGTTAATIRVLTDSITAGTLPDVYVTNGALTVVSKISGDVDSFIATDGQPPPLPVTSQPLSVDGLTALLAHHTRTVKETVIEADGKKETKEAEYMPPARNLAAVLSQQYWPEVRPLRGIVGSPVLRPDGTLLQTAGYDKVTHLYFAPKLSLEHISAKPTAAEVEAARTFLLESFLSGFPWVDDADRANYIGLLVAQILRPYLRTLTPFGLITATTQSSGKTLLSEGIGLLYGQATPTWQNDDADIRKVISTMLCGGASTVVWDNLREGTAIDSPVLAQLLTSPVWSDRLLGGNRTLNAPNDRLWIATGNNLRLGGDMATRTVLVRLDPKGERPELRTDFKIPDLDMWLKDPINRVVLLRQLLVLVLDWIAAGAKRGNYTMRQFTQWAAATGGFLAHHDIPGFLDNVEIVRELDDQDSEWIGFLARWHSIHGSKPITAKELLGSAEPRYEVNRPVDDWKGQFLTDEKGLMYNPKSLGHVLRGNVGRPHGRYVLRADFDKSANCKVWSVEPMA